jgi:hypothetical protein
VPTSLPPHFAFQSFSITGSPVGLDVSITDKRLLKDPNKALAYEVSFDTHYLKGTCSSRSRGTLSVGGRTVYTDGATVWQCVRSARGRQVLTSAHGRLAAAALGALVVSARPVR